MAHLSLEGCLRVEYYHSYITIADLITDEELPVLRISHVARARQHRKSRIFRKAWIAARQLAKIEDRAVRRLNTPAVHTIGT